ncbi:kinetochore-associated protein NSL1 homolog isoform X3 [Peromyscus californicus insignis]|uniref:kinetochore-associated protein NSL1 homolog isoform X3 n=1 Tax=Peromyscus californicus insignis TaxID=564181 RepID=UPI0022A71D98|nr:kinetochore-associated protein NSL1 homolog isoform X3 [Peromyscus californicus insignis]
MAGVPETVQVSASQGQDARTSSDSQASAPASPLEDFRVRCTLKRAVVEVMELCGRFVQELGAALPEDVRELALRDAQWTFESAVQENVSINGQAWQEAADHCLMDSDIKVLEDEFDELIVDVATKRRQYPRRILESVIKTLKAQHEILKQYRPVVPPLDLKCDPDPGFASANRTRRRFFPGLKDAACHPAAEDQPGSLFQPFQESRYQARQVCNTSRNHTN